MSYNFYIDNLELKNIDTFSFYQNTKGTLCRTHPIRTRRMSITILVESWLLNLSKYIHTIHKHLKYIQFLSLGSVSGTWSACLRTVLSVGSAFLYANMNKNGSGLCLDDETAGGIEPDSSNLLPAYI